MERITDTDFFKQFKNFDITIKSAKADDKSVEIDIYETELDREFFMKVIELIVFVGFKAYTFSKAEFISSDRQYGDSGVETARLFFKRIG